MVEHQEFPIARRFEPQVLGPICGPIQSVAKETFRHLQVRITGNLKVHPVVHVSLLKPVARDASRPNREHNSRPPPDLVHNEPEFEVEAVLKSRQLRGREREYLVKWRGYHPIEASWVNESDMEHAEEAIEEFHNRPAKRQRKHRT